MNVLKTAPQLRTSVLLGTFSGAKRWIDRKIDTNKTSKFTTTDGGWCRWLRYIIYQRASFLWGNNVFPLWFSRLSSESPESFIIWLTDSGEKLRYPSPLSCWSLCSCCYFKICLTETPLTTAHAVFSRGQLTYKSDGDARRKIEIIPLRETDVGVTQA